MNLNRSPALKTKRKTEIERLLENQIPLAEELSPQPSPDIIADQAARIVALENQLAALKTSQTCSTTLYPPPHSEKLEIKNPYPLFQEPTKSFNYASLPSESSRTLEPKVNNVFEFNGSRMDSEAFIIGCDTVFTQQPTRYSSESNKIMYAVSYLRGDALKWILPFQRKKLRSQVPLDIFNDWEFFVESFMEQFGIVNSRQMAVLKLKRLTQNGKDISSYFSELRELENELEDYSTSSLKDSLIAGLDEYYLDKLQYVSIPEKMRDLKVLLLELESRKQILELQLRDRNTSSHNSRKVSFSAFNRPNSPSTRFFSKTSPSSIDRPTQSTVTRSGGPLNTIRGADGLNHITPEIRRSRMLEGRCTYCGELGHFVGDCPNTPQSQRRIAEKKPPDKRLYPKMTDTEKQNVKCLMAHLEEHDVDDDEIDIAGMDAYTDSSSEDGLNKPKLACVCLNNSKVTIPTTLVHSIHAYKPSKTTKIFSQLFCSVNINDTTIKALMDSGASASFIDKKLAESLKLELTPLTNPTKLTGFEGDKSPAISMNFMTKNVSFILNGHSETLQFFVIDSPVYSIILGMDWLHKTKTALLPKINQKRRYL
jgi:hypothetical protein